MNIETNKTHIINPSVKHCLKYTHTPGTLALKKGNLYVRMVFYLAF